MGSRAGGGHKPQKENGKGTLKEVKASSVMVFSAIQVNDRLMAASNIEFRTHNKCSEVYLKDRYSFLYFIHIY